MHGIRRYRYIAVVRKMHVWLYICLCVALFYKYVKENKHYLFVTRNVIPMPCRYIDDYMQNCAYHKIPINYVNSANSVPVSSRKHGKPQVFLQTPSEPPAAVQPKQHALARALMQQPHSFAVVELTAMLKAINRHMSTAPVVVSLFLASIALIPGVVCCCSLFSLRARSMCLLGGDVGTACNL
jgi:hypothetical protein